MADARPFSVLDDLFDAAERVWFSLSPTDLLEVFAANGSERAEDIVDARLVEANRLYENKFGFIFILCTSGKTVDDVLAICWARLGNSSETELKIAADEQRKITEINLSKLLER